MIGAGKSEFDVFVQSNTSNLFRAFLQTYEKVDITLAADAAVDDEQITLTTGHGRSVGDSLIMYTDDYYEQVYITAVAGDLITLESPIYLPFPSASTTIIGGKLEMNVDGSGTIQYFQFGIPSVNLAPIDVTVAKFVMAHAGAGDDGKFGDLAQLSNGLFFRKQNSLKLNLGNYRRNLDFRFVNADIVYSDKGPGGSNATIITATIQGQENFDQVLRLSYGDLLIAEVRDDLTGLSFFRSAVIGSYTQGE